MKLPKLTAISSYRDFIDTFGGYNHNIRISDGEFYDMENLTSSHYPVLSPRSKRGIYSVAPSNPQGLISKDTLCYVDGTHFVFDKYDIDMGLSTDVDMCPKQLISMGAYVIIMPDKMYFNTQDVTDYGRIEAEYDSAATVTYEMCNIGGDPYANTQKSATEPTNPKNNDIWIDTSSTPHTLKQYSSASAMWADIATTYVKIACPNIARDFSEYDAVTITGIDPAITQLKDLEGQTSPLWKVYRDEGDKSTGRAEGTDDYIVVIGILDETEEQDTPIHLERRMPRMDFVIESGNRLWGCRYGENNSGDIVNEIYCSKLGDFKNWYCYMGLATDSYSASCGTDGVWTGAINYLGYPLFFKENHLHKVYGEFPSAFQITDTACRGVQRGSHNSLAIVNEALFYLSRSGVCVYDGSLPSEISSSFGETRYSEGVAGTIGNKYYLSVKDGDKRILFVYDIRKGMWHKESGISPLCFCTCRDELYYIDTADKKIHTILGSGNPDPKESKIKWMAETGTMGTDTPDKKYISRLSVRLRMGFGTRVWFYIEYDSSGSFEHIGTLTGTSLKSFSVPIKPKRCDHFRLRIVGEGDAKIYSFSKNIEGGSDK